jgi:hypothetical protein
MYLVTISSENEVTYLHECAFYSRESARDAARELSRDYPLSVVRAFHLGETVSFARYQNGSDTTYA